TKYLIFPILNQKDEEFTVERPEKYGGNISYSDYQALEDDFTSEELHPQDLKDAAAKYIFQSLKPIQERFKGEEELLEKAYPEEYGN
ncbi:MAG: tyrosine--tRNA ligase, partial [Candidatus Nanohaloarchaea archaeon]